MYAIQPVTAASVSVSSKSKASHDPGFRCALAAAIPPLRAYARLLSGSADIADDLVQETLLKAWSARDRFVAGSNMRAWTHVILRNVYFSQTRRARFKGEWNDADADTLLAVAPRQEAHMALGDLMRALLQLPVAQREAVIMIGAGGMTCEEVATICGCAVGTVKSRVARARAALHDLLDGGQLTLKRTRRSATPVTVFDQIMNEAVTLAQGVAKAD